MKTDPVERDVALERDWRRDLEEARQLDLPHVSLYGLTVEPQSPLGRWVARKTANEAPEESYESQFMDADELLTAAGYEHYEVSNYGKPGFHSRHNWAYWKRASYAGLGPSAHEFDGRMRRWNKSAYTGWLDQLEAGIRGADDDTAQTRDFVQRFVRPHGLDVAAAPLVVSAIKDLAALGRRTPERTSVSIRLLQLALIPLVLANALVAASVRVIQYLEKDGFRAEPESD
jgi:coproporphyrinogen III oxidase-like Fe-S oxidoreductase